MLASHDTQRKQWRDV